MPTGWQFLWAFCLEICRMFNQSLHFSTSGESVAALRMNIAAYVLQNTDIGKAARAPIGCSAATAAAYRARPGVTPDPIRALRARCVTSRRNGRGLGLKRSTRIAGAAEEAAPSEREHLQRDESLKSLAAPPSLPSCCAIRRYILSLLLCFMYVCVLAAATHSHCTKRAGRLFEDAPFPDHAALALADGDCPHCELVTAYGDSEDSPGILLRDCSSAPPPTRKACRFARLPCLLGDDTCSPSVRAAQTAPLTVDVRSGRSRG
ncbi:unnamed protein product [Leuciscus chuanchicus]